MLVIRGLTILARRGGLNYHPLPHQGAKECVWTLRNASVEKDAKCDKLQELQGFLIRYGVGSQAECRGFDPLRPLCDLNGCRLNHRMTPVGWVQTPGTEHHVIAILTALRRVWPHDRRQVAVAERRATRCADHQDRTAAEAAVVGLLVRLSLLAIDLEPARFAR